MGFEYEWIFKGMELKSKGNISDAINYYKKAITESPRFKEAHYKLAVAYEDIGEKKKAEDAYRNAIKIDPMFKEAWNNLGSLLYEQKRYKEALKCFDRARKIDPKFDHAARNYAATLFNLERSEKAIEILMDLAEKQPKKYENWEIILTIKADAISRTNSLKEKNWSIIERANHFFKKLKCALKKSLFHWLSLLNGHIHYLDTQLVEEISMFICA